MNMNGNFCILMINFYILIVQGSATGRATRPGNFRPGFSKPGFFRPGEKFNFEPGTRPGFAIQPGNRPGPGIPGSGRVSCGSGRKTRPGPEKLENAEI